MRSYLDIITEAPARGLSSTGGLVNFNIDKSLPVTKIKDKDGKTFDLHAAEDDAQKFIDGSNAYEKFDAGTAAPQAGGNEELDAIVAKYAKPGMTLADLAAAEKEAGSDSNSRYVIAYIAKSLGEEGLYRADGSGYVYLDGDEVKSARGGSMDQAKAAASLGLLPDATKEKIEKVTQSSRKDVADKAKEVLAAAGEETKPMDGEGGVAGATGQKLKRVQELLAKAVEQTTEESANALGSNLYKTLSYADQLLEEISAQETTELQGLIKELETELPNIADESMKQQIEAALNQYKEYQTKSTAGIDEPGAGEGQIDTNSDSAIAAAIKDPALWIKNEMPKELAQAEAKGLMKATERGKKKSASAAAVQQIMKQIASVTGNKDMDIDADGLYGPASIKAVKKAQELAGITADGDPGADTAAKLVAFSENPTADGGIADTDLNQDIDKAIELFKAGVASFGTQQNASRDFRGLISIVEGKLDEALSPEDSETLKGLIAELEPKMNDAEYMAAQDPEMQAKFKELGDLRKQYNDLVAADAKAQQAIPAEMLKAVKGMGTDEAAVYAAVGKISSKQSFDDMVAKDPNLIATVLDDFSGMEMKKLIGEFAKKGITITVKQEAGIGMLGGKAGIYEYNGKTYTTGKAPEGGKEQPKDGANPAGSQASAAGATPTAPPPKPASAGGQAPADPAQAGINSSKDNNMTNKTKLSEASMNISMNGDDASEVAALVNILKNAGMSDAEPVSQMPMYKDPHDDMTSMMHKVSGPPESPCGMGEDEMEEEDEYSNAPDETYGSADMQMIDLSRDSGVNAPKKQYKPASMGDNPMATENIRERLWAALNEKNTVEGRGRGKKKMKLKASRGNEDIETTEGSRGKKSRGKKSRG